VRFAILELSIKEDLREHRLNIYAWVWLLAPRGKKPLITLIEIDGFKTFQDFKLELSPFQVIVGPNGAGKSNLFDALRLLSHLVDTDLRSAFQELRGDTIEVSTTILI
jgi:ABC-type multidrug transport system fused ATPase/permease subunit